jgi:hypothetical protein
MPRKPCHPHPTQAIRDGPVQPGSPLYRLLELIARAIAQDLEDGRQDGLPPSSAHNLVRRPPASNRPLDPG